MDVIQFIPQFLYRIRYRLLWGSLIVTALVIYFTQFLPFSYTVNSNIYAGVTNASAVTQESVNYFSINSTFDNIINIGKSKGTLEKVSVRLLATCLVHGNEYKDTPYILAKHYRQLLQITPKEVLALVDRKSVDKTTENLNKYRKPNGANFVFSIFSQPSSPFFSYSALSKIVIKRLGNSDLIDIVYTCSDPGITQNTLVILEDELTKAYEILRFSSTRNVIAYFEEQVKKAKANLTKEEDDLMHYSVQEEIINYGEQTKALAITKYEVDDRYELTKREYEGTRALLDMLEKKMDVRARLIRTNTNLLQELDKVSKLNEKITEQEIFTTDTQHNNKEELLRSKRELKQAEENISRLSDNINEYAFSKEGVGIQNMVNEWLLAVINEAKAKAELKVLDERREDIREGYKSLSPVGTQVKRKERAVGIAEDTYREVLRGLSEARLRLEEYRDEHQQPPNHHSTGIPLDRQRTQTSLVRCRRFLRQSDFHHGILPACRTDRQNTAGRRAQQATHRFTCHCSIQRHQQLEVPWFPQGMQPSCGSLCLPAAQPIPQTGTHHRHQPAQHGRTGRKIFPCQIFLRLLEDRRVESTHRLLPRGL